jgi:hypothetical protein
LPGDEHNSLSDYYPSGYAAAGVEVPVGKRRIFLEVSTLVPSSGRYGSAFVSTLIGFRF